MDANWTATRNLLCQRWLHSHEEDTASEMVFRPETFAFPASRGRSGFELRADMTCDCIGIGPADRPVQAVGHWEYFDDTMARIRIECEGDAQTFAVRSVDRERLVIGKPA